MRKRYERSSAKRTCEGLSPSSGEKEELSSRGDWEPEPEGSRFFSQSRIRYVAFACSPPASVGFAPEIRDVFHRPITRTSGGHENECKIETKNRTENFYH